MNKYVFIEKQFGSSDFGEFTIIKANSEKDAIFQKLEYSDGTQPDYVKKAILESNSLQDAIGLLNKSRDNAEDSEVFAIFNLESSIIAVE